MNIKRTIAITLAVAMLAVTPPHTLIQHASASTVVSATKISHSYPYDCNEGSYDASQSPYDGTWYVRDKKLCKHESLAPHLYDDKGYCNYILHDITAVDTKLVMDYEGTYHGYPEPCLYEFNVKDIAADLVASGIPVTVSISGPMYENKYFIAGYKYKLKTSCPYHVPLLLSSKAGVFIDAYSDEVEVIPEQLIGHSLSVGTLSGQISIAKRDTKTITHDALACSEGFRKIIGTHKDVHSSPGENYTIYDDKGNAIGGYGTTNHYCAYCRTTWQTGGNAVTPGYTGDVYDKNGNKVGSISESDWGSDNTGLKLVLLNGLPWSTQPVTESNACITAKYDVCSEHANYVGPHYFCPDHGYVGTSGYCTYALDGKPLYADTKCYGFSGNGFDSISVYSVTIKGVNGATGYVDYVSSVAGVLNHLHMSKKTKYHITTDQGTEISSGVGTSVPFTMQDENIIIKLEPDKLTQTVTLQGSLHKTYNTKTFNLSATVS